MVKLFKKSNSISAKDYIDKKRNTRLYCDTNNNNSEGRHIGKFYGNKRLQYATNHSNLLKLTKGMFQHRHNKNVSCYYHNGNRESEKYNYTVSTEIENLDTLKNTNYTGERLVTKWKDPNSDDRTYIVDNNTKFSKGVRYCMVEEKDVAKLEKEIVTEKVEKNEYPISRLLRFKYPLNND